jgi:hypothetical protein
MRDDCYADMNHMAKSTPPQNDDIDDLLPGLTESPLWEGTDPEFASYVQNAFGIPPSIATVTIVARTPRGRSAVAIGGSAGAIVFVVTPDRGARKTSISPYVMGPLVKNADVVERAKHSDGDADAKALTALGLRHLAADVVLDLMAPPPLH